MTRWWNLRKLGREARESLVRIRPYRSGDESAVIQLWTETGLVTPQNNPKRDIERKLNVDPDWFLVGELDGVLVSTCMVGYEGHRGWINYLAVRPDIQRQGLGREMMEAAERILVDAGCAKINLQVRTSNAKVVQFYESIGYRIDPVVSLGKRLSPEPP